jgi:hypothetical protein
MLDIRRGIGRVGAVLLVLWELVLLSGWVKDPQRLHFRITSHRGVRLEV